MPFKVSTDDMKFWVARDDNVPVYAEEFTEIFTQQVGKAHCRKIAIHRKNCFNKATTKKR